MEDAYLDGLLKALDKEFGTTTGYNSIEDLLRKINLMEKKNRTEEEERQLKILMSRPTEPELARRLAELGKDREEKPENEAGGEK